MSEIKYKASPTLARFHRSDVFVRGLRGPIGSGKSVGCCVEIFKRATEVPPDRDGRRRSRWAAIRNTYPELKETTIKTWREWFDPLGIMRYDAPPTFRINKVLEDGTTLDLELIFLAIDNEQSTKKLLSLELTGVWLNEARELPYSVVVNAMSRVGRFPPKKDGGGRVWSGIIMDTNSPSDFHWWYKQFEEVRPENWKAFDQPPALLEEDGRYVVNPLAENLEHLPKGPRYYLDLVSGAAKEWIDVMLLCQYKSLFTGKKVYAAEWRDDYHVSKSPLVVLPKRNLILSFDFGLTPACVAAQEAPNGQLRILAEYVSEDMGLTQFLQNYVMPDLRSRFRDLEVVCIGDPAGVQRSQHNSDDSCAHVFKEFGLDFTPASTNDFEPRRRSVLDRLNRSCCGEPAYLVDPGCTMLRMGFNGGYQFKLMPSFGSSGEQRFSAEPEKNIFSHIHDANQYLCLYLAPEKLQKRTAASELILEAMRRSRRNALQREEVY